MHMVELQRRIEAPGGLVVSGTGSSIFPIPIRRAGETLVAGFLYEWFPAPQGVGRVHLVSPERVYFLNPSTGNIVGEERPPDGGRDLGPASSSDSPPLSRAESEANKKVVFEAMDRLFFAFAHDQPCQGELGKDAATYRAAFNQSVDPALVPYYLRIGVDWFPWVGLK